MNMNIEFDDSLLTEIILLKSLSHENIIKYFGYSFDYVGNFYIITELCSNGNLDSYLINNKLTIQQKYKIIYQICKGINYLHTLTTPIIHRDLKTQNVLLDNRNLAKVADC